jgi:acetyltransferase-like isoleucine patch superfamily enzyme
MNPRIHPTADVKTSRIGENTLIWQYCVVLEKATIGSDCNINCHVLIENDVVIGNFVTIKPGVQIWDGIRIGDYVFIGPNVTFTNDLTPRSKQYPDHFLKTKIDNGASIGANSTIIAGIEIGQYAMIGAGSLVNKNIPAFTLWYGNPARHKGYVTKSGELLDLDLRNKSGKQFVLENFEPISSL